MSTEKTIDELLAEFNSQPWNYYSEIAVSNKVIALKVAATLKNDNLNELLSNADKIEKWLTEPNAVSDEIKFRDEMQLLGLRKIISQ